MHLLFPSQQENETIHLVIREHWIRLALKLFIWTVFAILPIVLRRYYLQTSPELFDGTTLMSKVITLFEQIYDVFLMLSLLVIWLMYYLNMQIITSLRVVDVDQTGLFSHTVAELHINNIEDVTSETKGILGTMFDYGNVYIQTAGTVERFILDNIAHPGQVEKIILDLYEQSAHGENND